MSAHADYLDDLDPDDPRPSSQQIANLLRAAILTRKLSPGDRLPSQNELASRYGVARMTASAAIDLLDRERLVVRRQGSGVFVRAQTERPVGLRPLIEVAFGQPKVTIDFAGLSGETLYNALSEVLDKVRAGRLTPESIRVRALIADTRQPMAVPRSASGAQDTEVWKRADRITRRSVGSLVDSVTELADLGLVKEATADVRAHNMAPMFKVFILNGQEAFFGYYPVREHVVNIGGDEVPIYDLLGKDSTLFHFTTLDDDSSHGPAYVEQTKSWFESVWSTVAREYQP